MFRVHMFGRLQVWRDGSPLDIPEARKVQELFCFLLLHRGRPHPREVLAAQLWGDVGTESSKKHLRHVLWLLQSSLGGAERLVLADADWVQVNPSAEVWLDTQALEQAYGQTRDARGDALSAEQAAALHAAAELYQADLLDGWYQDWCLAERERYQMVYMAMLDQLMGHAEAVGAYADGLAYGARVLRQDRAHERTHRRLMRLYYRMGDRAQALRQFDRCVAALREELHVQPSRLTAHIYEQVCADALEPDAALPTPNLQQVLDNLQQCWAVLAQTQQQLQHNIQAVEQALLLSRERGLES